MGLHQRVLPKHKREREKENHHCNVCPRLESAAATINLPVCPQLKPKYLVLWFVLPELVLIMIQKTCRLSSRRRRHVRIVQPKSTADEDLTRKVHAGVGSRLGVDHSMQCRHTSDYRDTQTREREKGGFFFFFFFFGGGVLVAS